ncbi:MAG: MFS transporter [Rhizobiaceae bacterium]
MKIEADLTEIAAYGEGEMPAPATAVASVILSMALIAVGNGLIFAFVPLRLALEGLPPVLAGSMVIALSAGGIAGCFLTGILVRRVGHARVYMTFSALIILSSVVLSVGLYPVLWLAARAVYGIAITGLFIVSQSWLNDVVGNDIRGRVLAIFYVSYIVGIGVGSYLIAHVDVATGMAPLVAISFAALSIVPVGLTRLRPPPPPETASISVRAVWRISPVALVGMLAVGGLTMMIAGFTPIHLAASGYSKNEIALLMLALPLGTLLVQLPAGWLSDRVDRRCVLAGAALIVIAGGMVARLWDGSPILVLICIYVIWAGATESIYSISNAHASDRAERGELVQVASTMLFAWSLSGFLIPAVATTLTAIHGTITFIYVAIVIAALFVAFTAWRIATSRPVPADESGSFAPMTAQAPVAADLAYQPGEDAPSTGPGVANPATVLKR